MTNKECPVWCMAKVYNPGINCIKGCKAYKVVMEELAISPSKRDRFMKFDDYKDKLYQSAIKRTGSGL